MRADTAADRSAIYAMELGVGVTIAGACSAIGVRQNLEVRFSARAGEQLSSPANSEEVVNHQTSWGRHHTFAGRGSASRAPGP